MATPAIQKLQAMREELVERMRERIERMRHIHSSQGLDLRDVVALFDGLLYLSAEYPEQAKEMHSEKL